MKSLSGRISVSFWFIALMGILVYSGSEEVWAFVLSILVHEAGHLATIYFLGYNIKKININTNGIQIDIVRTRATHIKEILISASGSFAGLLFSLFAYFAGLENLFAISLFLSLFNLIPIRGLDGGSILLEMLINANPVRGAEYFENISKMVCFGMIVISGALFFLNSSLYMYVLLATFAVIAIYFSKTS